MACFQKNTMSILQQNNQHFDVREELVKRLEIELAQYKADMMVLLHDSEVLKASFDELKSNILGDELVNQREAYQLWEDTLKKAKQLELTVIPNGMIAQIRPF